MADKKPDPGIAPPKTKLLMVGGVLLVIGLGWFLWEAVLRSETEAEAKERKAHEAMLKAEENRQKKMKAQYQMKRR